MNDNATRIARPPLSVEEAKRVLVETGLYVADVDTWLTGAAVRLANAVNGLFFEHSPEYRMTAAGQVKQRRSAR